MRALFAVAILAIAAAARAEESPLRLVYVAPSACPDRARAQSIVSARTAARLVDEKGSARLLVEEKGGRFAGTLETSDVEGAPSARTIEGASCAEVIDALAVVAAMQSANAPPETPPPEAGGALPVVVTRAEEPRTAPPDREGSSAEVAIGLQGGLVTGAAPNATPRGDVVVGVGFRGSTGASLVHFWPRARVAFGFGESSSSGARPVTEFSLLSGSVDVCPLRLGGRVVDIAPCLRGELGSLSASTDGVANATKRGTTWVALGALALLDARIAPPVFLQASVGAVAPLQRDRFTIEPSTSLHRVSPLAFVGGVGIGVAIW